MTPQQQQYIDQAPQRLSKLCYEEFDARSLCDETPEVGRYCSTQDVNSLLSRLQFILCDTVIQVNLQAVEDRFFRLFQWSLFFLAMNRYFQDLYDGNKSALQTLLPSDQFYRRKNQTCPNILSETITDVEIRGLYNSSFASGIINGRARFRNMKSAQKRGSGYSRFSDIEKLKEQMLVAIEKHQEQVAKEERLEQERLQQRRAEQAKLDNQHREQERQAQIVEAKKQRQRHREARRERERQERDEAKRKEQERQETEEQAIQDRFGKEFDQLLARRDAHNEELVKTLEKWKRSLRVHGLGALGPGVTEAYKERFEQSLNGLIRTYRQRPPSFPSRPRFIERRIKEETYADIEPPNYTTLPSYDEMLQKAIFIANKLVIEQRLVKRFKPVIEDETTHLCEDDFDAVLERLFEITDEQTHADELAKLEELYQPFLDAVADNERHAQQRQLDDDARQRADHEINEQRFAAKEARTHAYTAILENVQRQAQQMPVVPDKEAIQQTADAEFSKWLAEHPQYDLPDLVELSIS